MTSTEGVAVPGADRVFTIPNLISVARLACVPWFLWLLLGSESRIAAAVLLAVLGGTDWVDGWIARHFDQGSDLGKALDPIADRILLVAAGVGLLIDGAVPLWVAIAVLAREAIVSLAVLLLTAAGARRLEVQWVGKAGTLAIMFALPGFLLADAISNDAASTILLFGSWVFTIFGLALSYYAALMYIPQAKVALREGRAARSGRMAT